MPIRQFIGAMNYRKQQVIVPGQQIVVDECMSQWKGIESLVNRGNHVHVTKIQRKPKSVGFELKASADGESGILLNLELQEGVDSSPKKYSELQFHAAITLRLVDPWLGKQRVIIADAAFGSLLTCTELLKRGTYFLGAVKQCHKGYPTIFFSNWSKSNPPRGSSYALQSTVKCGNQEKFVTALGWIAKSGTVKPFIGSCSTTLEGDPLVVPRHSYELVEGEMVRTCTFKETNRCRLLNEFYKHFGVIDLHDRYRQGYLQIENEWHTHRWYQRLFSSLLGMIATDAYLGYQYEHEILHGHDSSSKLEYKSFMKTLCRELIFNNYMPRQHSIPTATKVFLRFYDDINDGFNPYILFIRYIMNKDHSKRLLYTRKRKPHILKITLRRFLTFINCIARVNYVQKKLPCFVSAVQMLFIINLPVFAENTCLNINDYICNYLSFVLIKSLQHNFKLF